MSCLAVNTSRIGGIVTEAQRVPGGIDCETERVGGISVETVRLGGIGCEVRRTGGIRCQAWQVCKVGIRAPYLRISPEVIWVLAGGTENDVYSNTRWNVT